MSGHLYNANPRLRRHSDHLLTRIIGTDETDTITSEQGNPQRTARAYQRTSRKIDKTEDKFNGRREMRRKSEENKRVQFRSLGSKSSKP